MRQNMIDRSPICFRQSCKNSRQLIGSFAILAGRIEHIKQIRIQGIREQGLGQLTQIRLQNAGHRMNVDFFEQLFSFVVVCRMSIWFYENGDLGIAKQSQYLLVSNDFFRRAKSDAEPLTR